MTARAKNLPRGVRLGLGFAASASWVSLSSTAGTLVKVALPWNSTCQHVPDCCSDGVVSVLAVNLIRQPRLPGIDNVSEIGSWGIP